MDVDYKVLYKLQDAVMDVIFQAENILSNKLTAAIGRDNAKDIFDIYLIDKFYDLDWKKMLEVAHQKSGFSDDDFDDGYTSLIEKIEEAIA